ncbi:hypothetical protein GE21DRAFT_1998 [Neurospora crassa]|uniref:Uncharacterized protein n=1 Tax=Neurospora crassa (strain ATCC 24698 / 74-OR23-1A / CBS 708.71 / DSM 1257 / FGSC 987) TaxID=367110 RepID=Q7SES8_NEUCR|nr:hypothetical protein NCU00718 [Neurospora crassa OR74A]EAA35316.1 hypothetical protein NCU00718 [Neurospora crassa OR74A]KHE89733.1 hypothetical protein GE21DRAFT_1998 [Neurospora crassa]|eukprot:XP_964552.1 hypothetical protein NCU00718 [Neurospora crassa OR74A]
MAVLFMKLKDVERALAAGLLVDKGPDGEAGVPGTGNMAQRASENPGRWSGRGRMLCSAETDGGFQTYRNEENGDHCKAEEGDIGCGWSQRRAADLPDGNYG